MRRSILEAPSLPFSPCVLGEEIAGDGSCFLEVDTPLILLASIATDGQPRSPKMASPTGWNQRWLASIVMNAMKGRKTRPLTFGLLTLTSIDGSADRPPSPQ